MVCSFCNKKDNRKTTKDIRDYIIVYIYYIFYILYICMYIRRRYKGCKKVSRQPSKANSGNKGNHNIFSLILTLNNFIFNSRDYLQTKGCAMGTLWAPSYANIFMDHFLKKLIYPFIKGFSLIYLRFIDDIFFIWTGNKKDRHKTRIH